MTNRSAERGAPDPGEQSPVDFQAPQPADWVTIARVTRASATATLPLFALPKSNKAALIVILIWWPLLLSILFIVAATVAAYLFGLAVATVGMSHPLPERKRTTSVLTICSCGAAATAVLLTSLGVAALDSQIIVSLASVSAGSAIVVCIMLFRRHLQRSDRWQPRRSRDVSGVHDTPESDPAKVSVFGAHPVSRRRG